MIGGDVSDSDSYSSDSDSSDGNKSSLGLTLTEKMSRTRVPSTSTLKIEHGLSLDTSTLPVSVISYKPGGLAGPVVTAAVIRHGVVVSPDKIFLKRKQYGLSGAMVTKNTWINLSHLTFVRLLGGTYATVPFLNNVVSSTIGLNTFVKLYDRSAHNSDANLLDPKFMTMVIDSVDTICKVRC